MSVSETLTLTTNDVIKPTVIVALTGTSVNPIISVPASLPFGDVAGGRHVSVPGGGLDRAAVDELTAHTSAVVVTPWRGVLIPEETR